MRLEAPARREGGGGRSAERGAIERALARSVLYEALSVDFRPPSSETWRRLRQPSEVCALAAAAALLEPEVEGGLTGAVLGLALPPREAGAERGIALPESACGDLEACYRRLFGHTTRGLLSAYETEYGEDTAFQQPQQLGDLAGFLGAFGLQVSPEKRERVDHVSVECEFMAFLARKEAYALEQGFREMLSATRAAQRAFLRDHLGRFASALGRLARREDPAGFYGALGELCRLFVSAECAAFRVPAGPELLPLRVPAEDNAPMACGRAEELLQIRDAPASGEDTPVPLNDTAAGRRTS